MEHSEKQNIVEKVTRYLQVLEEQRSNVQALAKSEDVPGEAWLQCIRSVCRVHQAAILPVHSMTRLFNF